MAKRKQGFRLFRAGYNNRNGKACEAAKWYVEFRDQLDTVPRLPAYTSKAASEELGRNVVKLVAYFKGSRQGPDWDGMSGEERALARHSTITLTMDRYSHTLVGEQAEALAALPDLSRPAAQEARRTGTEDVSVLASSLALSERSKGIPVDSDRRSAGAPVQSQSPGNEAIYVVIPGPGSVCTSGGGPGLQNQWRV